MFCFPHYLLPSTNQDITKDKNAHCRTILGFFFFLRLRVSWLTKAILMCGARQEGAMLPLKILTAMAGPWNHILNYPLSFVGICCAPSCQITTANILWANMVPFIPSSSE